MALSSLTIPRPLLRASTSTMKVTSWAIKSGLRFPRADPRAATPWTPGHALGVVYRDTGQGAYSHAAQELLLIHLSQRVSYLPRPVSIVHRIY